MKTRIILIVSLLLMNCICANRVEAKSGTTTEGSIDVKTSHELYNLAITWANEYSRLNPQQKIMVSKASKENLAGEIGTGEIGFISAEDYQKLSGHSVWSMVVGRDVVVPVMNAKNPLFDEISHKGITLSQLSRIVLNPGSMGWNDFAESEKISPLNLYVSNDQCVLSVVGDFLKVKQLNLVRSLGTPELISAIQNDPNALGLCKLVQITDQSNSNLLDGLRLVPIDKNGNGKIDYMEDIYTSLQSFTRGIWIGKYPQALSSNIYSVSSTKPVDKAEIDFIKWVLSDGQRFLNENGYSDLVYNERLSQLGKIGEPDLYASVPIKRTNTFMSVLLLCLVTLVISGVLGEIVFRQFRRRKDVRSNNASTHATRVFNEDALMIPNGLYFGRTHSWAFMKKNGSVRVGIDDFLQHVTGKITRVELKTEGETVKKGELLLSIIRKGKLLNIYSPISGTITEVNKNLEAKASLLNSSPYSDGWVYSVEPTNWGLEMQYLSIAEKYKEGLKDEFLRLKDFFATLVKVNSHDFEYVTLQDGGELVDNPLAELGPNVWDDFQTKFIDTSK